VSRGISRTLVAVVTTVVLLAAATEALADGGTSIAGATPATFDQQYFGNTANGGRTDRDCGGSSYRSWWTLNVKADDLVTIDWESSQSPLLNVYPVGTTDFNLQDQPTVVSDTLADNHKYESRFQATVSGVMPVEFLTIQDSCNIHDSDPGPYDFFVTVKHGLFASLSVAYRSGHRTYFEPGASGSDGSSIDDTSQFTIQPYWKKNGLWRKLGSPLAFNTFFVRWAKKDRGHWQYMKVRVSGPGYQSNTSRTLKVKAR
jgi:hypothetical protein